MRERKSFRNHSVYNVWHFIKPWILCVKHPLTANITCLFVRQPSTCYLFRFQSFPRHTQYSTCPRAKSSLRPSSLFSSALKYWRAFGEGGGVRMSEVVLRGVTKGASLMDYFNDKLLYNKAGGGSTPPFSAISINSSKETSFYALLIAILHQFPMEFTYFEGSLWASSNCSGEFVTFRKRIQQVRSGKMQKSQKNR